MGGGGGGSESERWILGCKTHKSTGATGDGHGGANKAVTGRFTLLHRTMKVPRCVTVKVFALITEGVL